jgi:aspartate beta-hydroxylase
VTTTQEDPSARLQALWRGFEHGDFARVQAAAMAWQAQGAAPPALDLLLAALAQEAGLWTRATDLYRGLAQQEGAQQAPARMGWAAVLSAQGDNAGAEAVLHDLLRRQPDHYIAHLRLGELRAARGAGNEALGSYYAAIVHAQRQGRWLSEDSTAPALRERVRSAMDAVDAGRRELFLGLLEPLRRDYGTAALDRVQRGLLAYLGLLPAQYADPSQRPTFFHVPDLSAAAYPPLQLFPWLEELEQATAAIRAEMLATREHVGAYAPFLGAPAGQLPPGLLAGDRGSPAWDAYFFYRHGQRDAAHAQQCAATAAALERTPLVRIRAHAPEICFSVLAPGTHILPHRGVTNTRLTVHLPLLVHGDCALRAGGQLHVWQEGRAMVFDDTFEHEAWNRSDRPRVILLMDTWNPHLQPVEREAVTRLVEGIGDFNAQVAQ